MDAVLHIARAKPTGKSAWFGVLAILLLQFGFATHALDEHDVPLEADSHCEICIKLDKNGNAPLAQMPSHGIPIAGQTALSTQTDTYLISARYSLPVRGPPAG